MLDSAYPVRGESGWFPSLTRTGIRSLAIVCRRSNPLRRLGASAAARGSSSCCARPRAAPGRCSIAIGSSGYEPPRRYYTNVNEAVTSYLTVTARPMRRLTRAGDDGYGQPALLLARRRARGQLQRLLDALGQGRDERERRRKQLAAAIRSYPPDRFRPFTPREVALESFATYPMCIEWPQPTDLYEPPAPPGAAGTRCADPGDRRRARRRHQRRPRRRRSPPSSRGRGCGW